MTEKAAFLRNCWYVAAWDHELLVGQLMTRTVLEEPVLLYRGESGNAVAMDNRCCHRGAKLSNGRIEGDCVRCMYHGLKFDATGKCVQIPGQDNIPAKLGVRGYPIVEHNHLVWIWMGDVAKADPTLIVDIPYMSDPAWRGVPGYMHYAADYRLIVDNLSDFAHLAFVHTHTLGGSEEYAYKTKPVVMERQERGFRVVRWSMNAEPPPFHQKVVPGNTHADRRNLANMKVPGVFMMETLFSPAGAGAESLTQEQASALNGDGTHQYRNCQFFTPETRRSTHFFWNYLHNTEIQNPAIAQSLYGSMVEGFLEDKFIIEGQQEVLEADPNFKMHAIVSDAPLAHFRRVLQTMIDAEQQAAAERSPLRSLPIQALVNASV